MHPVMTDKLSEIHAIAWIFHFTESQLISQQRSQK